MTINKIKKEITQRLEEKEIEVNAIKIKNYNKENKTIKNIIISLNDIDTGENVLVILKNILDDIEEEFNLQFLNKMVEF